MNIIYLHGLSSSGNSNTAHRIKELFPKDNVIAPDLPVDPFDALRLIDNILKALPVNDTIVIGTSMGGMFRLHTAESLSTPPSMFRHSFGTISVRSCRSSPNARMELRSLKLLRNSAVNMRLWSQNSLKRPTMQRML